MTTDLHSDLRTWTVPAIDAAAARIGALARTCDLDAPAVGLGRWRARDVVAHLGGVHRWAARIVTTRSMDGPGFTKSALRGDALCEWFDEGAHALVGVLLGTDPDERCPNFNPGSRSVAGFWHRRQAHETTIHRWDLERCWSSTTPIEPAIATDGIEEYLAVFVRSRGKQTLTAPLALTAAESGATWTVRPAQRPGRVEIEVGAAPDAAAGLAGPAADVLLHLWQRLPIDRLTVTGDTVVAAGFRPGAAVTPATR